MILQEALTGNSFCSPKNVRKLLKTLVALTGIEWVSAQFSWVQFSLSRFISVLLRSEKAPYSQYGLRHASAQIRHQSGGTLMERAADVLRQHHGDLLVSKQRLSQTDSIQLVRFKRENGGQELAYSA